MPACPIGFAVAGCSAAPNATFVGDAPHLLDQLVSACQEARARQADPRLYGRALQPYQPDAEPATASHTTNKRVGKASSKAKRSASSGVSSSSSGCSTPRASVKPSGSTTTPSATRAATPKGEKLPTNPTDQKQRTRGTPKKPKSLVGEAEHKRSCVTVPASASKPDKEHAIIAPKRSASTSAPACGFAGPGFCCSPGPEALPLPPAGLLRRT